MSIMRFRHRFLGIPIGALAVWVAFLFVHTSDRTAMAQQTGADSAVTYARDVAPIFQKNCQQCHQPGAVGPMPLTTFQEVRPWARAIKQRVLLGEMPPYRYDRGVGIQNLKHDLRLSDAEIQTIARWVDGGSSLGDPADLPQPLSFADPNKWSFADELGPP